MAFSILPPFALLLAALLALVAARPEFVSELPNGNAGSRPGSGITCTVLGHAGCVPGAPRNAFGLDFARAGLKWTKALCEKDSDGDGLTNGQELGDPCCKWTKAKGGKLRLRNLSHPGDKSEVNTAPKRCPDQVGPGPAAVTCGAGFSNTKQPVCTDSKVGTAKAGKYTVSATAFVRNNAVDFEVSVAGRPRAVVKMAKITINGDSSAKKNDGAIRKPRQKITTRFYKTLDEIRASKGKKSCCTPPRANRLSVSVAVQVCRTAKSGCLPETTVSGFLMIKCERVCKPRGTVFVMSAKRKCPACKK